MHKAVTKKCFRFTSCLQQDHKECACHAKTESICARAAVWRLLTMPTPCISMVRFEYTCKRPGAWWTAANLTQNRRKTNKQIHQQAVRQTAKQTAKRAHKTIRNTCAGIIEGSLEVKLPTIWTVEKQRWEESEEKRSEERRWEEKESEERRCRCAKR